MNWLSLVICPLVAALIGWIINRVAINSLFQPRRQQQFAQKLGKLVSAELSSVGIEQKIASADNLQKIMPLAEVHIDEFLRHKLKDAFPMIGMFIGDKTINQLKGIFMNELETIFPVIMTKFVANLQNDLDMEQLVADKVSQFPLKQRLSKELNMAALLGAVSGFVIGIVMVVLMHFMR